MNEKTLELLLKKCSNIRKINLKTDVNRDLLSLFSQYCPNIKSLTLNGQKDDKCVDFFLKYGHKLEELVIYGDLKGIKKYLKLCLNLKIFKANNHSLVFNEDKEFLPKLEYFEKINSGYNYYICANEINQLKIFLNKYYRTMKRLNVWFGSITKEEVKTCTQCISRFENLRQLKFTINLQKTTEPIDNCLSLIGQKCTKLLKLDLSISSLVTISERFFDVFTQFKAIKKLKNSFMGPQSIVGKCRVFQTLQTTL